MKEKVIKVVKIEPMQPPQIIEIENELESLQREVAGLIECTYLPDGNLAIINEEGKINGMEPNRRIENDIICGAFFICGDDGERFTSLTNKDMYRRENMQAFIQENIHILAEEMNIKF